MTEIWKLLPGTNDEYEVSNMGRVRSLDHHIINKGSGGKYLIKGRLLKACKARNGYLVVNIRRHTEYVHRLIAMAFIGAIPKGMSINHINGDKSDNRLCNLEIVSYSLNVSHSYKVLGRKPSNLGHLNHGNVKGITQLKNEKEVVAVYPSAREAERQTGISHKGISACLRGTKKQAGGYIWKYAQKRNFGLL